MSESEKRLYCFFPFFGSYMKNSVFKILENIYEVGGDSPNRITAMEGLRGLAVILVFFVHYHALFAGNINPDSNTFAVSKFLEVIGNSGVDLFFVLSGYLIYGAVIKNFHFFKFISRRIQRIYPTFLVVFAVYLAASFLNPAKSKIPDAMPEALIFILQNILLLPGIFKIEPIITVAWSLSYEFFFYLLLPLLVAGFQLPKRTPLTRIIFFVSLVLICIIYSFYGSFPNLKLVMFASGILAYEAVKSFQIHKKVTSGTDILAILTFLISLPLTYLLINSPENLSLSNHAQVANVLHLLLLFVTFLILVLTCIGSKTILKTIFSWTPLRWLGNMSYSYYLIHGFTLQCVALAILLFAPKPIESVWIFWICVPIFFTLTWISSTILFVLIEKPFSIGVQTTAKSAENTPQQRFVKIVGNEQ